MNLVDKAIEYFSPERAYRRGQARLKMQHLQGMQRKYEGAAISDRLAGWTIFNSSPRGADGEAINLMTQRVRYLYDNSSPIKRGINAISSYTIGPGIVPHAVKADGHKHERLEGILKDFADTPACDLEERETLYAKQHLAGISVPRDGEFLIQRVWVKKNDNSPLPIRLKCLLRDHIDSSKNEIGNYKARIINGVEYNSRGERVALWIKDNLPGEAYSFLDTKSQRYDIKDFCHIFRANYAGQTRGITWGAPIIIKAKDFDDYMDAQLLRQKISSCFVGVFQDADPEPADEKPKLPDLKPGTFMIAPEGKTVEFSNPPQIEGMAEYVSIQHHGIASGLEVPYMIVASDFTKANYTNARMTILDFYRQVVSWQQHIYQPQMNYRIGRWILEACELQGIRTNGAKLMWSFPKREYIDPEKDLNAYIEAVKNGFISHEDALREHGLDPDDVYKSIEAGNKKRDSMGIILPCDFEKQLEMSAKHVA